MTEEEQTPALSPMPEYLAQRLKPQPEMPVSKFEAELARYHLDNPIAAVQWRAGMAENHPYILAVEFANICDIRKLGYCAATRTEYTQDADGRWVADVRG